LEFAPAEFIFRKTRPPGAGNNSPHRNHDSGNRLTNNGLGRVKNPSPRSQHLTAASADRLGAGAGSAWQDGC